MKRRQKYMWVKKFGDAHYPNGSITLCGIPMLGNNYNNERPETSICEKCEQIQTTLKEQQNDID